MMEQQDVADAISLDRLLPKERSVLHHIWSRFAGRDLMTTNFARARSALERRGSATRFLIRGGDGFKR